MPASTLPPNHAITTLQTKVDSDGRIEGIRFIPALQVKRIEWLGTWGVIRKYQITLTDGNKDIDMVFSRDVKFRKVLYSLLENKKRQRMVTGSIVKLLQYKQVEGIVVVEKVRIAKRDSEIIFEV
jgi:hypothetical protein